MNGDIHKNGKLANGSAKADDEKKKTKTSGIREKTFVERKSLITELLEIKYIKDLYYMFVAVLLALFVNYNAYDIIYNGGLNIKSGLIYKNFSDLPVVAYGWLCMSFINLFTHSALHIWAYVYEELLQYNILRKGWNYLNIICLLFYYVKAFKFAGDFVLTYELSIAGSIALLCEQTRLVMKCHAYVRSNVPKVLNSKPNEKGVDLPTFQHYVYFLFVPTLVYKDEYPRNKETNWKNVFCYCMEIVAVLMYLSFVYESYFMPVCGQFKNEKNSLMDIAWVMLKSTLPAIILLTLSHYLLLHAWMNAFAEITRFADRQFYQDWWNSTSYSVWYRKWNIVVHDWLHVYVYRDLFYHIFPGRTILCRLCVFFLSSIVHEYILSYTMRMFYPMLFVLFFGFGVILTFMSLPQKSISHVLFMYNISLGTAVALSTYVMEYCVRMNDCAVSRHFEYYEPRSFAADCLK